MIAQLLRGELGSRHPHPVAPVDARVVVDQSVPEPALTEHPVGEQLATCQVVGNEVSAQVVNPAVTHEHAQRLVKVGFAGCRVQERLQTGVVAFGNSPAGALCAIACPEPRLRGLGRAPVVPEAVEACDRVELLPPQQLRHRGRRACGVVGHGTRRVTHPLSVYQPWANHAQCQERAELGRAAVEVGGELAHSEHRRGVRLVPFGATHCVLRALQQAQRPLLAARLGGWFKGRDVALAHQCRPLANVRAYCGVGQRTWRWRRSFACAATCARATALGVRCGINIFGERVGVAGYVVLEPLVAVFATSGRCPFVQERAVRILAPVEQRVCVDIDHVALWKGGRELGVHSPPRVVVAHVRDARVKARF